MTVVEDAARTARRMSRSDALELLTRLGFVGYGVLHLSIAWLAAQIAQGHGDEEGDQTGALRVLSHQPFGRVVLVMVAVGLAGMALWQLLLAFVGHRRESRWGRVFERIASVFRSAVYTGLAWTAAAIVFGSHTSAAESQEHLTRSVLSSPGGRIWVEVAGAAVIALGLGMVVYGVRRTFEKRLRVRQMHEHVHTATCWLGQVGYAARGTAFAVSGLLLAGAGISHDTVKSRGLDAALRTLAAKPFGGFLLWSVATGFAAFGLYCFFQARYRRVHPA
jgi:hypothetical protein